MYNNINKSLLAFVPLAMMVAANGGRSEVWEVTPDDLYKMSDSEEAFEMNAT